MVLQPASEFPTELPSLPKICLALVVALAPGLFRAAARYRRIGSTEKRELPSRLASNRYSSALPPSCRRLNSEKIARKFTGLALVGPWMLFANPRTLQANSEVSARGLISNFLTTGVTECKSVFGTSSLRAQSSDWSHGSYFRRAGAGRWKLLLSRQLPRSRLCNAGRSLMSWRLRGSSSPTR
jgi:hypothetical protein